MLLFILIFFVLFCSPIVAQSFNYQFKISYNSINLNLFETIEEAPTPDNDGQFLSFDYQLSSESDLPPDWPLFLATLDNKVLFYADQNLADGQTHQVAIDTNGELPIFYKNTFIKGLELDLNNFHFVDDKADKKPLEVEGLLAIREKDQSLTILISINSSDKNNHSFELFCADNNQSAKLNKVDDFLWTDFNFLNFLSNHQDEFIFHLNSFDCFSNVYLLADGRNKTSTSIINIEDL